MKQERIHCEIFGVLFIVKTVTLCSKGFDISLLRFQNQEISAAATY